MQFSAGQTDSGKLALLTARLLVRLPRVRDAEAIVGYYSENQEHLTPTEPQRPPMFFAAAFWRDRIATSLRDFAADRSVRLVVERRDSRSGIIGMVNFTDVQRGALQACNLGYSLALDAQGHGFMTEALEVAIGFMFEQRNLHRIHAGHLPENLRSAAVLRRLGFEPYGYARDYLLIGGRWRDHVLNSLTNANWRSR